MARTKAILLGALGACLLTVGVSAQGPYPALIQAALRDFLTVAHSWTATQTFQNVTVTGTCTGCGSGGSVPWSSITGTPTTFSGASSYGLSTTSANLASALTDETGTGVAVFSTSPTLVTPILGTPTSVTLTNGVGLPSQTLVCSKAFADSPVTMSVACSTYFVDATNGAVILTLPASASSVSGTTGWTYTVVKIDNSVNTVTITRSGSDTINGATTLVDTLQYDSRSVAPAGGTAWFVY